MVLSPNANIISEVPGEFDSFLHINVKQYFNELKSPDERQEEKYKTIKCPDVRNATY